MKCIRCHSPNVAVRIVQEAMVDVIDPDAKFHGRRLGTMNVEEHFERTELPFCIDCFRNFVHHSVDFSEHMFGSKFFRDGSSTPKPPN